jgi:hypothetical protein
MLSAGLTGNTRYPKDLPISYNARMHHNGYLHFPTGKMHDAM